MNLKQISLKSFFKRKGGTPSDSGAESSDESEYVLSKTKLKYSTPMFWTRVKDVYTTKGKRIDVFNVEDDLKHDKALK